MISVNLFGGMAVGRMAMEYSDIFVTKYYSSEIDKYACQATNSMFPDTIQLGDVTQWREWDIDWPNVDLVTGGFPCQAWSLAGKQLGDKDERGMLFWVMLDIMKHARKHNPKVHFIIENVKMKKDFEKYITKHTTEALGDVHKILINSALVSAQNRNRYYWTSFPVTQPQDEGILLRDILENVNSEGVIKDRGKWKSRPDKSMCIDANYHKGVDNHGQRTMLKDIGMSYDRKNGLKGGELEKSHTLSASDYRGLNRNQTQKAVVSRPCELREGKQPLSFVEWGFKFHPNEFEGIEPDDLGEIDVLQDKYMSGCGDDEGVIFEYDVYLSDFLYGEKSPLCHHVATANDVRGNQAIKRIYADTGKSPTLTTMQGGHQEPKVLLPRPENIKDCTGITAFTERRTEEAKRIRRESMKNRGVDFSPRRGKELTPRTDGKMNCLTATYTKEHTLIDSNAQYRKLTPRECFRLQTILEHYINILLNTGISNSQLYKMCGNAWTMRVMAHILNCMVDHDKGRLYLDDTTSIETDLGYFIVRIINGPVYVWDNLIDAHQDLKELGHDGEKIMFIAEKLLTK